MLIQPTLSFRRLKYVVFEFPSAVDQAVDKENLNNIGKFS